MEMAETDLKNLESIQEALKSSAELLEELAEDMSGVFQQFKKTQDKLDRQEAALTDLGRDFRLFKSQMAGDKVNTAFSHAFQLIVQKLDQLEITHAQLDEAADAQYKRQLESVISTLLAAIGSFGYTRYAVAQGEPFDPARMHCLSQTDGEKDTVVRAVTSGYMNKAIVVRTASVIIGK